MTLELKPLCAFFLLCAIHQTLTAVLVKNTDIRNMFTERACCRRQSHVIYVGKDISGSPVNVDVGVCKTHCGQSRSASFESLRAAKSMLEFLRNKKMRRLEPPSSSFLGSADPTGGLQSCGMSSTCEPTGMRVDRLMLYEGLRDVEIIQDCHCEAKITQCVRAPALKTYYSETPYEAVIDAGKCVGSKGTPEGFSCVPTKFDSTLIETPNKVELIQTVAQCELMQGCYRAPYVEHHFEVTHNHDGVKVETLREIDVGRCLGRCTAGSRCLLRSATHTGACLLRAGKHACVPQDYESHTFLGPHGQTRTVLSITSCLCQS